MTDCAQLTTRTAAETITPRANDRRPVDLVHLAHYTMGNRALELEVLELFRRQSTIYLERLQRAGNEQAWREAVHALKGTARGIGAWDVAEAALAAEQPGVFGRPQARTRSLDDLSRCVEQANRFVQSILTEA